MLHVNLLDIFLALLGFVLHRYDFIFPAHILIYTDNICIYIVFPKCIQIWGQ